jgi:hypothetical protein
MHKSPVTERTPYLKDASVFSISCYNALCNTCNALPLEKGRTPMFSATPWITDSTMVQNIVIIAIVSNLQWRSSYIGLQLYKYTAESIVAMSLHLHHVPQVDMLECRLVILLIVPHPKNLHV